MAPQAPRLEGPKALLRRHWPAIVVLAIALGVRVVGLLPLHFYGDDAEYATVARSLSLDPTALAYPDIEGWGPHPFVSQPPLLLYLFALAGSLLGSLELGSVAVSVVLGTATVGVVYALGVELGGRWAGGLAGLFLAVLPEHVSMSRQAHLDAGLTFFVGLSVLCFVVWTRKRSTGWALATGTAAAMAAFSKLYGVLVYVPLVAGLAVIAAQAARGSTPRGNLRRLAEQTGWAALPGAVLSAIYLGLLAYLHALKDLWDKLAWQVGRVSGAEGGAEASKPWHWYLTDGTYGLPQQLGWAIALIALAGLSLAVWRALRGSRSPAWLALAAWPVTILGFFTLSGRKIWFYVLPALPGLAVLAGLALAPPIRWARERLAQRSPGRRVGRTVALVAVLLVASIPALGPALGTHERHLSDEPDYGYGVKEAAVWIDEEDPEAGQVGTLLGRFTLHFYNGHRTYHSYVPDAEMHRAVEAGEIRYVVMDDYLVPYEQNAWMQELVDRYDGRLVKSYDVDDHTRVKVYELHPSNATQPRQR